MLIAAGRIPQVTFKCNPSVVGFDDFASWGHFFSLLFSVVYSFNF